ncbi:hypothetical protein TcWFU_009993 [Taenia crassiceps]|uniref:Uncharacterized protein n=1 Tax=Taenia crassiceps TaxID=6207 RepID=A0ABR4Q0X4_9CEST
MKNVSRYLMSQFSLRLILCCVVLAFFTNAVYGAPNGFERPVQIDDTPEELSLRDYLNLVRLKALKEEMDDGGYGEEESFEKRARFRPRLGKRSYNFRARLG